MSAQTSFWGLIDHHAPARLTFSLGEAIPVTEGITG